MHKKLITIGTFDGVHLGHRKLFKEMFALAKQNNLAPLALVFKLPPKLLLAKKSGQNLVCSEEEKFNLLKDIPFKTLDFFALKDLSAQVFFALLLKKYNMGGLIVGRDFAFGKDRAGTIAFLRTACVDNDVKLFIVDFEEESNAKISSSRLRSALQAGEVEHVNKMLGHNFTLEGKVIKGAQLGRKIGFPTANLKIDSAQILPRGVFAVRVFIDGKKYNGICNIGKRPTVEINGLASVEVHILNFDEDIYGHILRAEFISKLRDEKHFSTLGELTEQINKDSALAQKILN